MARGEESASYRGPADDDRGDGRRTHSVCQGTPRLPRRGIGQEDEDSGRGIEAGPKVRKPSFHDGFKLADPSD